MAPLLVEDSGHVRVLTLNRPEARNALSGELISALYRELLAIDADDDVHAAVLTGANPAFCAGLDLKQAAREGQRYFDRFRTEDCINQVGRVRKPVIGAVNGAAFTGGLEMALGCDFLLASENAAFADTHVRVGVLPGGGLTARLPQLVGPGWARRMSMTGEVVTAALAERIGLVTEVVPDRELRARAVALASAVAEVRTREMVALKGIYSAGTAVVFGPAFDVEVALSGAHRPDLDGLDERATALIARNSDRLARGNDATRG
ncbi:MAG TPA: enoyl-CoA hydratase [Amycolatopsis sp.]|nr:enoyl-CoA hydratase [Amycolatopsis sp.]